MKLLSRLKSVFTRKPEIENSDRLDFIFKTFPIKLAFKSETSDGSLKRGVLAFKILGNFYQFVGDSSGWTYIGKRSELDVMSRIVSQEYA